MGRIDDLPELTPEERAKMESLPPDFAKRLWERDLTPAEADAAYDAAEPVPIPDEEINLIVKRVTGSDALTVTPERLAAVRAKAAEMGTEMTPEECERELRAAYATLQREMAARGYPMLKDEIAEALKEPK